MNCLNVRIRSKHRRIPSIETRSLIFSYGFWIIAWQEVETYLARRSLLAENLVSATYIVCSRFLFRPLAIVHALSLRQGYRYLRASQSCNLSAARYHACITLTAQANYRPYVLCINKLSRLLVVFRQYRDTSTAVSSRKHTLSLGAPLPIHLYKPFTGIRNLLLLCSLE